MKINEIYNESCLETMAKMPDGFLDCVITSPPYDNLREYKGFSFPFEQIAIELKRVLKPGGVIVWVVGDAVIDGSESGTSFKQALFFKSIGLLLHDTMIWEKESFMFPSNNRYHQTFDFMFIITKDIPKTFNPIKDRKNKYAGTTVHGTQRRKDGTMQSCHNNGQVLSEYGMRHNVWKITSERQKIAHPAPFCEQIPHDHILTWSNEGDLIYDPFGGSGTTAKMAHLLKRNWILSEISGEYCRVAKSRLSPCLNQNQLNF